MFPRQLNPPPQAYAVDNISHFRREQRRSDDQQICAFWCRLDLLRCAVKPYGSSVFGDRAAARRGHLVKDLGNARLEASVVFSEGLLTSGVLELRASGLDVGSRHKIVYVD